MINKTKTTALIGVCIALAMILSYIELLIPPLYSAIPGIKMGLSNIVIVFLLYRFGSGYAFAVSILRVVLVSLLFGNVMALMYSLAGAVLSLIVMIVLRKLKFLSTVGVSVAGAVAHNVGQVLMAMLLLDTTELGYYMVVLVVTGTISGTLIGLCGAFLVNRVPEKI